MIPKGHHGPPPRNCVDLVDDHLSEFMKRLRAYYPARAIRYFGVGEYGEKLGRPHFHAALYGVGYAELDIVRKAWGLGEVHMGDLTHESAQYIAGYVCKKMTKADDKRLGRRPPEFARMSRNPGIGASAIPVLRKALAPDGDLTTLYRLGDVPPVFRTGGKLYPLGRYMRQQLRASFGWDIRQPEAVARARAIELDNRTPEETAKRERDREGQYESAVARFKIHRSKSIL